METYLTYAPYAIPLVLIFLVFARRREKIEITSSEIYREAVDAGLTQPPSLHPVIDTTKCIGCESCINACPEFPAHQVLGILRGKAHLVSPTDCIGHGACKTVCPVGAISLVFGTETRGIEIPTVNSDFSTGVDGVYIAGELGGMGLIRNAIEQGRQAMQSITSKLKDQQHAADSTLDVLIVGAGPAGISSTLGAMDANLKHVTIEQNALGGTVANFPRGKLVMTAPVELPIVGQVNFTETRKEELVEFWNKVHVDTRMNIQCNERLVGVTRDSTGLLTAKTDKSEYRTRSVLLAIGRRGTPRTLGVPGEEQTKVTYSMIDPCQYNGQSVLVVGGGDSAIEAACSIAEETDACVTLSYRSEAFSRAKKKNRDRVAEHQSSGKINVLMGSNVTSIEAHNVLIEQAGELLEIDNDAVIVCAGGILPNWLLEEIGIGMETKYGTA